MNNLKYTSGLGAATGFEKTRIEIGGSLRGFMKKVGCGPSRITQSIKANPLERKSEEAEIYEKIMLRLSNQTLQRIALYIGWLEYKAKMYGHPILGR